MKGRRVEAKIRGRNSESSFQRWAQFTL